MNRTLCFLFVCIISIQSFAQAPGYMGKKFLIGGAFSFGSPDIYGDDPATVNSKFNSVTRSYPMALYWNGKIFADYVITEKKSISVDFKKSTMGFHHINSYSYFSRDFVTELDFTSVDIGLRMHSLGNVAPIGFFLYAGLGLNSAKETDPAGNSLQDSLTKFRETKVIFGSLNLSVGHHILLGKNIILTPQIEANLINPLSYIKEKSSNKDDIAYRWQRTTWFNLSLGLSYLLF